MAAHRRDNEWFCPGAPEVFQHAGNDSLQMGNATAAYRDRNAGAGLDARPDFSELRVERAGKYRRAATEESPAAPGK